MAQRRYRQSPTFLDRCLGGRGRRADRRRHRRIRWPSVHAWPSSRLITGAYAVLTRRPSWLLLPRARIVGVAVAVAAFSSSASAAGSTVRPVRWRRCRLAEGASFDGGTVEEIRRTATPIPPTRTASPSPSPSVTPTPHALLSPLLLLRSRLLLSRLLLSRSCSACSAPAQLRLLSSAPAAPAPAPPSEVYYKNCAAVRAAERLLSPWRSGYAAHLDRDGDGIACE